MRNQHKHIIAPDLKPNEHIVAPGLKPDMRTTPLDLEAIDPSTFASDMIADPDLCLRFAGQALGIELQPPSPANCVEPSLLSDDRTVRLNAYAPSLMQEVSVDLRSSVISSQGGPDILFEVNAGSFGVILSMADPYADEYFDCEGA